MQNSKTFYKRCSTREQAVDFAEKSQGTVQEDNCTVSFDASYSISKALFNVKSDKYRVYQNPPCKWKPTYIYRSRQTFKGRL